MARIVTLTTDFGDRDGYVAEMKGELLSRNRDVVIVDVTHKVPPQDIAHGAYVLGTVAKRFPEDTIHIGVVDPGVGTNRRPIVIAHRLGVFVGPDNGLFTSVLSDDGLVSVNEIDVSEAHVSSTFHGRDVFAPAAARISLGTEPADLGPAVGDPVRIDAWQPKLGDSGAVGRIVHIDRFGNGITNLSGATFKGHGVQSVKVGDFELEGISETYGSVGKGEVLALIGSQETLEISVNAGSARDRLNLLRGMTVTVSWQE